MVQERISCHADLRALQDRSDRRMLLKLVSLDSVSIASDSYALLRSLIERRNWRCSEMDMDFLSLVASVAVELHKMKLALSPLQLDQEAKPGPGEGFPKDLLFLKNSALALLSLWEDANEIVKKCVGSQDVFLGNAENVGGVVEDFVNQDSIADEDFESGDGTEDDEISPSPLPYKNIKLKGLKTEIPFSKSGKLYTLELVTALHSLCLPWTLPCLHKEYMKRPAEYLAHLLSHGN